MHKRMDQLEYACFPMVQVGLRPHGLAFLRSLSLRFRRENAWLTQLNNNKHTRSATKTECF